MKCELIGQEHHGSGSGGDVSGNVCRVRKESKSLKKKRLGCINNQRGEGKKWQHLLFLGTEKGFKVQMITRTLKKKTQQHKTQIKSGHTVITACIMYERSSHLCVRNCGTRPSTRLVSSKPLVCSHLHHKKKRDFPIFFFLLVKYWSGLIFLKHVIHRGKPDSAAIRPVVLRASALRCLSLCSQRPERASSPFSREKRWKPRDQAAISTFLWGKFS